MTATAHGNDLVGDSWWPPELPADYRYGDVIGVGGTATVYGATHVSTGSTVAVKVLRSTSDSASGDRFAAEVRTLRQLRHPGLAEILDAGVAGHHPFLVTRFIDGETLHDALRLRPLDEKAVVELGGRLAATLAYVHSRGIVHRDVKPSNVLLDGQGSPFLTDFGVSRIAEATRMTETGVSVGTPAYMAPEQVRGEKVGPAADIYALGLVLLEAVTGRLEYPGGLVESAVARLHRRPRIPAELSDDLRSVLQDMTADDPGGRPTAAAVAERLGAGPASGAAPAPGRTRRVAGVLAMAVAAAVLVLAVNREAGSATGAVPSPPAAVSPVGGADGGAGGAAVVAEAGGTSGAGAGSSGRADVSGSADVAPAAGAPGAAGGTATKSRADQPDADPSGRAAADDGRSSGDTADTADTAVDPGDGPGAAAAKGKSKNGKAKGHGKQGDDQES